MATATARWYSQQELGAGEVVHTLQEADDGEAVCAPRSGHKKTEKPCTPRLLHAGEAKCVA